jgi:hypothetical protein
MKITRTQIRAGILAGVLGLGVGGALVASGSASAASPVVASVSANASSVTADTTAASDATSDTSVPVITPASDGSSGTPTPPAGQTGTPPAGKPGHGPGNGAPAGPHVANGITETVLTGDDLAKATAAVEAAQPGATIERAETDADGDAFEAHVTLADGSRATVKMDASFKVTSTETGR